MADFRVTNTNDSGAGSLRQAIIDSNAANGTDRIVFDNSLSGRTINLTSGQIRIADDLVIEGLNADSVEENITINAGGNSRVFLLAEDDVLFNRSPLDVTIKNLNITGGSTSSKGGAIYVGGDTLREHNLTIESSILSGNNAGSDGGAIYFDTNRGNLTIFATSIRENSAGEDGGGIATEFGDIRVVSGSTIEKNSAGGDGGGVYSIDNVFVNSSLFVENKSGEWGGGLYATSMTILQSSFIQNQAVERAGGIRTNGATVILNSNIINNESGGLGGGIEIGDGRSANNFARTNSALIANTTISGNKATRDGGGIWLSGGLLDQGEIQLAPANLLAINVTITNNVADSNNDGNGNGGGIFNTTYSRFVNIEEIPGNILFRNSIIAGNFDNTPEGQGEINPDINGAARGDAHNLLGNHQGLTTDELFGVPLSESLGEGSDLKNIDPKLGSLQIQANNGTVLTAIHPLLPGSHAINAGNNDNILRETFIDVNGDGNLTTFDFDNNPDTTNEQLLYDQRLGEFSRIVGGTVDIGAFELQDNENTNPDNTALTLTGGTAQIAYVAYYGRPADKGGLDFWNDSLTNSEVSYSPRGNDPLTGAEEDIYNNIVNQFGNSAEADRLFGAIDSNRDKVNQVYQFAFNRDGDDGGLDFWTEQIDLGNVTLATFALEVALGAQNEDIVVLNNKINSADLFSNGIDTQAKTAAYSGSTGEIFGREWLGDFGEVVSSQVQVDEALTNLVNQG